MLIRIGIAGALLLSSVGMTNGLATQCGDPGWVSTCRVENTGSQIDIGATKTDNGSNRDTGGEAVPKEARPTATPPACVQGPGELCRGNYTTASLPEVTMADLASFRPAAPGIASEPVGIGIAGAPTNLVSSGSAHTAGGTLFGYAVTVRFTPIEFRFQHGDGTSHTAATPGATWDSLRQPEFTPTATSHAYAQRGEYSASVIAVYTAQVDFGGGWRDVPGTLELPSAGYPIRIVEARTALVEHTCHETPTAPGC